MTEKKQTIKKKQKDKTENTFLPAQEVLFIEDVKRGRTIQLQSSEKTLDELLGVSLWIKENHFQENNHKRDYV